MMMNNFRMTNPMMNQSDGMMNPTMMNNFGMMNPMMMYNYGIMNNDLIHQNINLNNINNTSTIKVFLQIEKDNFEPVIINKNDSIMEVKNKLLSCLDSKGKSLCRGPYPGEIIERINPKETLEYLIERGVIEKDPEILVISRGNIGRSWTFKKNYFNEGDKLELYIPLRGAGGPFIEFADIDKLSKTKKLNFSKNAKKWRKVS